MNTTSISVRSGNVPELLCRTVILVPALALSENGHIKMVSMNTGPQTKHEFYALTQTAFMQFQDEELAVVTVEAPIRLEGANEKAVCESGMAVCRDLEGHLHVWVHGALPQRKLLEAAHRFCTRWIRLDI